METYTKNKDDDEGEEKTNEKKFPTFNSMMCRRRRHCVLFASLFILAATWGISTTSSTLRLQRFGGMDVVAQATACHEDTDCVGKWDVCEFSDSVEWLPADEQSWVWERTGQCMDDTRCRTLATNTDGSDGSDDGFACSNKGTCRLGECTYHFGYTGRSCEISTRAFATLVTTMTRNVLVNVLVWARSIRLAGFVTEDIIAMVTPRVSSEMKTILRNSGLIVREVKMIPLPDSMANPKNLQMWDSVFSKLYVFGFTEYSQIVLMDYDSFFNPAVTPRQARSLFSSCNAELCGTQVVNRIMHHPDFIHLNAGVMVIRPSALRLKHMLSVLSGTRLNLEWPEQMWLQEYADDPSNAFHIHFFSSLFNGCGQEWSEDQVVIHRCSHPKYHAVRSLGRESLAVSGCPEHSQSNRLRCQLSRKEKDNGEGNYPLILYQTIITQTIDSCFQFNTEYTCGSGSSSDDAQDEDVKRCSWHESFCFEDGGLLSRAMALDSDNGFLFSMPPSKFLQKLNGKR